MAVTQNLGSFTAKLINLINNCHLQWTCKLKKNQSAQKKETVTESQHGWGWKWPLEVIWSKLITPADCPGPCLDWIWVSPRMETLPHPWAIWDSAWSPSQWKGVSGCSEGTTCISPCAHCLWSCYWAPLEWAWLHPLCTLPAIISTCWEDPPEPSLLQGEQPQLFQPLLRKEMLWSLHHLYDPLLDSPVAPSLFCSRELRTRPTTPGVASLELSREEGSSSLIFWQHFTSNDMTICHRNSKEKGPPKQMGSILINFDTAKYSEKMLSAFSVIPCSAILSVQSTVWVFLEWGEEYQDLIFFFLILLSTTLSEISEKINRIGRYFLPF